MGTSLLQRTTRKLSPYRRRRLVPRTRSKILYEIEAATAELTERRSTLSGPLRISAPVHRAPASRPGNLPIPRPASADRTHARPRRPQGAPLPQATTPFCGTAPSPIPPPYGLVPLPAARARRLTRPTSPATARRNRVEALSSHRGLFYSNRGIADWQFPPEGCKRPRKTGPTRE